MPTARILTLLLIATATVGCDDLRTTPGIIDSAFAGRVEDYRAAKATVHLKIPGQRNWLSFRARHAAIGGGERLGAAIAVGDSVVKAAYSDTLRLLKDGQWSYFFISEQ